VKYALYQTQGAYPKAERLYLRALDIRERVLRPVHPRVAADLKIIRKTAIFFLEESADTRGLR